MLHVPVFWALLLTSTALALRFGGGPERWTAGMFLAAAMATRLSYTPVATRFQEVEISAFAIDLALLLGLLTIAIVADRFWPICMVAIHSTTVAAHVARALDQEVMRRAYSTAIAAPADLTLLLLLAATIRHQRRLRRDGADSSWNTSLLRGPPPTPPAPPTA